ncbi:MAG: hypothetical protein HKN87_18395 [Saprospiraceae bacterium]|nr:hypothetical protein [Saprospiraceae bacterium]
MKLSAQSTILDIEIRDKGTSNIVPTRIEIRDSSGVFYIAEDAYRTYLLAEPGLLAISVTRIRGFWSRESLF